MPLTDEVRVSIFNIIKKLLNECVPPMQISKNSAAGFELIGNKPVPYGSKKIIVPGMYFSSVVPRKDMVSYYFFPMYMEEDKFLRLLTESKKFLKGKTCFNFKKPEQVNEIEFRALLKKGVEAWHKLGYLA